MTIKKKEVKVKEKVEKIEEIKEVKVKEKIEEKVKKVIKLPANPRIVVEPLLPFDRWFKSKGFKPHWKAGMKAYTNTSVRLTFKQWDEIFKSY